MRFLPLGFLLLALPVFADGPISLRNDREGTTYYGSSSNKRSLAKAIKEIDKTQISAAFEDILSSTERSKLCSYNVNTSLLEKLTAIRPKFDELEGAILALRDANDIDDVVAKILLQSNDVMNTRVSHHKDPKKVTLPSKIKMAELFPVIAKFESTYLAKECFDEAYRSLFRDLRAIDREVNNDHLEALLYRAFKGKHITQGAYGILERARINKLEMSNLSLKAYYQKIRSLRTKFPLRDENEKSNFVSQKVDKNKLSRRQLLLEHYSDIQIIVMSGVVKKLRARLESPKVEILIYDREQGKETITLRPMERFRLAIKLLRKEMSALSINPIFEGGAPDYLDLMTASYEVGIIPATELDELAGIQDIWNPKKTFWEKARVWVQTLSSVATIVIPPPYGFIPALAIVVIEATVAKKADPNEEDPTSLF